MHSIKLKKGVKATIRGKGEKRKARNTQSATVQKKKKTATERIQSQNRCALSLIAGEV